MKMKNILIFVVTMLASLVSFSQQLMTGKVIAVIDGNTFELRTPDNDTYKILLFGIDCPELGQDFGDVAKLKLEKMILNQTVAVEIRGKDRWGNRLGVIVGDGATDPRMVLLEAGLAWTAEREPAQELEAIREQARNEKKGLWSQQDPTPPWTYRRQQTMTQLKTS